jgi:peptidoglycan/xylan/chitin deacetylase (PgdA/CDA1 family)
MKAHLIFAAAATLILLSKCSNNTAKSVNTTVKTDSVKPKTEIYSPKHTLPMANAATILGRRQVPILCYHQIRNWTNKDSKSAKDYITPVETFKQHIKMLADSGYHSILPDQLFNYLAYGDALPTKPVMITFDDTDLDQYIIGASTLKQYGYKGVYFIMTVSIGKRGRFKYMDKAQIKELSDAGNTIASHTYDHQNVKKYQGNDWEKQIEKPTQTLETITGKKINHFAYPFGLWNPQAIPELKKRGFKDAYILATKRDPNNPLFTIRRIIASGYWSAKTLHNSMVNSFGEKRN